MLPDMYHSDLQKKWNYFDFNKFETVFSIL